MRFLLYIYFLLAALTTFAQKKYLILEDKSDKTQFAVKEGRWLKVTYHNGNVFRGSLHIDNDSVVSIGAVKLRLNEMKSIQTISFGAGMFKALVITTGIVTYLVASAIIVIYIAVLVVSIANGNPIDINSPDGFFHVEPISLGINALMEVGDSMEKSFPKENFNYSVATSTIISKD